MTPQPSIFIVPAAIVVLARNATPLRFSRRQSMPAADGTTAGPGPGTFLELLARGRGTGTVRTETERL